jgi:Glycosyl transferase family 2
MRRDEPLLSICIPTHNRAQLLDYCLENLAEIQRFDIPFEVVVSDNASTDETPQILATRQKKHPWLRQHRQAHTVPPFSNWINALRSARGRALVYLADDDSLVAAPLMEYARRIERESDLVCIYADWVAYDDNAGQELHRYFRSREPASFGPEDPWGLVTFVFEQVLYPEIGVYRRDAYHRALTGVAYGVPFHYWMYRLSRMGRIAFEPEPFYREHRVLKPWFRRTHWLNTELRRQFMGDELRMSLENVLVSALEDADLAAPSDADQLALRRMVERYLHSRTALEIQRAVGSNQWVLAWELRRRLVMWHGAGSDEEQARDFKEIAVPAVLQAVHQTLDCMAGVERLALRGFRTSRIRDHFALHYPDVRIVAAEASQPATLADALVLCKRRGEVDALVGAGFDSGRVLCLELLLEQHRVSKVAVDLDTF